MGFDKNKAKQNAERFLTHGRISSAIVEYNKILENDSEDFNTANILGDLYVKSDNNDEAIDCYQKVAEHYSRKGFNKKAIAIYNKIYRLSPDSIEISAKLAELYQVRGALVEAGKHYEEVAKHYEETGKKQEALQIWEKVTELSPKNTKLYLKIAAIHWQNDHKEEAAKAFIEGGKRLVAKKQYEEAVAAFSKALEVLPDNFDALEGYVNSQVTLGYPEEGVRVLEGIYEKDFLNAEIASLLANCYLDLDQSEQAEKVLIDLFEKQSSNFLRLLSLVEYYLEKDDLDSAVNILSICFEQLLVSNEPVRLLDFINEILARNPEHLEGLQLLIRYHSWRKDNVELQKALVQMSEAARLNGAIGEEKYALSQLLVLVPNDSESYSRLEKLNEVYDETEDKYAGVPVVAGVKNLFNQKRTSVPVNADIYQSEETNFYLEQNEVVQDLEQGEVVQDLERNEPHQEEELDEISSENEENAQSEVSEQEETEEETEQIEVESDSESDAQEETEHIKPVAEVDAQEETEFKEKIENIRFYIEQGYLELAKESLKELEQIDSENPEIKEIYSLMEAEDQKEAIKAEDSAKAIESNGLPSPALEKNTEEAEDDVDDGVLDEELLEEKNESEDVLEEDEVSESTEILEEKNEEEVSENEEELKEDTEEKNTESEIEEESEFEQESEVKEDEIQEAERENLNDLIEEFDSESENSSAKKDLELEESYELSYQHGIFYKDMGRLEDAIKEFQNAINFVDANNETIKFLQCCTLLGHCFMEKEMPKLAIVWFERAFEVEELGLEEKLALQYELGKAFEAGKQNEKAREQFEEVYANDVKYRNVKERLESLK